MSLPRGIVTLDKDIPARDVALVSATTSLLSREQKHEADPILPLRQLFAQAAQKLHGDAGWFNRARDFPNTRTSELPVSPEGDRAINGTPPIWQRYLPFWASNLGSSACGWVLGGLIVLMLPLSKVVPPLYTFACAGACSAGMRACATSSTRWSGPGQAEVLLDELDELDRVANKVTVPLSYAEELYALRNNIDAVRRRLLAKKPAE